MSSSTTDLPPVKCRHGHSWSPFNICGSPWEYCRRCAAARERPLFRRLVYTRLADATWLMLLESAGGDATVAAWIREAIEMRLEAEAAVEVEAVEA